MRTKFDTTWITDKPIAHRGLFLNPNIPENSLLAFKHAIDKSFPIELDLQRTRDGVIVVFHDDELLRVCNDPRNVCDIDWSELQKIHLFETDEKISSFKEVLSTVAGKVPLLIEIKNRKYDGEFENDIYHELEGYEGEYAIQSFNPFSIDHFRKLNDHIPRGMISGSGKDFNLGKLQTFLLKNLILLPKIKPHFINYEAEGLNLRTISLIRRFTHIPILAWTISDKRVYQRVQGLCDNVIFEKIDMVAK